MGYRSLEWNWPKETMNIPIRAGIFYGAKLQAVVTFLFIVHNVSLLLLHFSPSL